MLECSNYMTLDCINDFFFECLTDKVITRFVQDRLRLSTDERELKRFYNKILRLEDKDLISLSNNQVGNYIIQICLTNIYRDNMYDYQQSFNDRLTHLAKDLAVHRYGCRVMQTCLNLACIETKIVITSQFAQDLDLFCNHNNAGHVIQKVLQHIGTFDKERVVQQILGYVRNSLESLCMDNYSSRIVQSCF